MNINFTLVMQAVAFAAFIWFTSGWFGNRPQLRLRALLTPLARIRYG